MKNISLPDTAFEILTAAGGPMSFADLYAKIVELNEMTPEERDAFIGRFYTDLSLDGRIVGLADNTWDLRSRHQLKDFNLSAVDVYTEDEGEVDAEDAKENAEYDAAVQGRSLEDEDFVDEEEEIDSKTRESKEAAELLGLGKNANDY
ncbi:MAG: DNA-directed RNA polymerase subunit delta [Bacilli bacterium]|nr:DNA-directed RNA polymerase subunit delta [Bacilli bacterium]